MKENKGLVGEKPTKPIKGKGFTSYSNAHIKCNCLSDHLFRFKIVLESHMGNTGIARVKLETIAEEMGKNPKSASRAFHWFLKNSNLKAKKVGYIYEFYTSPDQGVLYGRTLVSRIMVHECPHIKRLYEKDFSKNTEVFNKEESGEKECKLISEISEWVSRPIFSPMLSVGQNRIRLQAALQSLGYEKLNKAYKSVAISGGNPHPKVFWEVVEGMKSKSV